MRTYQLWMASLLLFAAACSSPDESKPKPLQPASVQAFLATPAEVIEGDPIILSWDTKNTIRVRIEDARGTVLFNGNRPEGTFSVVPQSTTMYRLFASGRDGTEVSQQVAVKTLSGPGPDATFKIEPAEVPIGSPIHLVWDTSGTTQVRIRREGKIIYESSRLLSGTIEIPADDSAIYQFTAEGRWGKRELSAEVKVKPVILSFSGGTSAPVQKGTETSVSWKTRGANELVVRTPEGQSWPVPVSDIDAGSMLVTMGDSGRFELVAKRGEFEVVQTQDVAPLGSPRINRLVASPSPITEGELFTVNVSWEVDWALGGTLSWDGNVHEISWLDIEAGSLDIQVSTETSIVLQARNHIGTSSTTYVLPTILAPAPALIGPRRVGPAETFSLAWNAPGASEVFLYRNGELLDIPAGQISGGIDQQVAGATTWRLDAKNPVGSLRSTTMVTEIGGPRVAHFASDEPRYGSGAPMRLSWEVDGGTGLQVLDSNGEPLPGCTLNEGGGLIGGCTVTAPTELGTYEWTLFVENSEGSGSRSLSFRVGEGPALDKFVVDAPHVMLGQQLTLTWSVLNDVEGTVPDITIVDNRGGSWNFRGTHVEEGRLVLTADQIGPWEFELRASVPGKEPLVARAVTTAVGVPAVNLTADSLVFDLATLEPLILEWTASHAILVEIFPTDPVGEPLAGPIFQTTNPTELSGGTLPVVPWGPGQGFRIIATNEVGATAEDIVFIEETGDVVNPILDFRVSATSVPRGSTVKVDWTVWGFDAAPTLTPFLNDPAREITATAPFINIRTTGTPVTMAVCNSSGWTANDEGCQVIGFPAGFSFPFDGVEMSAINVTANGTLSTTLSTNLNGTYFSGMFPTEEGIGREFTQFGVLWGDLGMSSGDPVRYQLFNGPEGRHLVIQWSNVESNTFQAVLWESGAVDYRYASMSSSGSSRGIGWQDRDRTKGNNLNGDRQAVPGGLSNRSWRWFERTQPGMGSQTFTVNRTTVFTLCARTATGQKCERRTVNVQ